MFIKNFNRLFVFSLLFLLFVSVNFAQTPQPNRARVRTYDVQHYILRVSFDRADKIVFGDTTVQLKPLKNNFRTIELDQADLKFESVTLEPQNVKLEYKTAGEKIYINLDKTYSPEDLISVRLKYSTTKPKKGVYFVDAQTEEGKIVREAQIWTQGEAEEAHFWFPSYDFPDDKATSEQFITTGADETAIGNGEQLETKENPDGTKTFHYKMPVAHSTYLTSFVVGKYTKISDSYKNIPLNYYVYPDRTSIVSAAYGNTKNMMRIFEELTGIDYPYNKYDQTIVANFAFGGMENITATTMADTEIFLAQLDSTRGLVEDLVSHELAHSWFGNMVTCKNWSELWLNEGFATFMEAAYREKMYGRQDYMRKIRENAEQYKIAEARRSAPRGLFFPAALPDEALFNVSNATITYLKGGAVVHTLRETVGDENFWKAINIYLNRHKFQNVESKDLQKVMEETSRMNLDWFFSQWIYGAGFPKLSVRQIYNPNNKTLSLTVTQTQKPESKVSTAFRLPMNVEITTPNGASTENIEIKKRVEIFTFKVDDKPSKVLLDREEKIPLKSVKYL
ncbi:MAG: M1 family metallopeptidase [Acidobacteriota bacterium]|nr:M1 family metallopeptidase [Acidobacteriota bacterium]